MKLAREDILHLADNLRGTDDNLASMMRQLGLHVEWPSDDADGGCDARPEYGDIDDIDDEAGIFAKIRRLLWKYARVRQCQETGEWKWLPTRSDHVTNS